MKRRIAIILITLEIVLAVCFLAGGVIFTQQVTRLLPLSDLTMAHNTLRQYADALDAQRDNWDRIGGDVIPSYAVNLRELGVLANDLAPAAALLRTSATFSTPQVLGIPSVQPLRDMEDAAMDLEALLPRLAKTLEQTAVSFDDYTENDHKKLIESIDSTILLLRNCADTMEARINDIPKQMRLLGMAVCFAAAVMLLFASTQLLLLPPTK